MQIWIHNQVSVAGQVDIVDERHEGERVLRGGKVWLTYRNEAGEKVSLRYDATGLVMTRFMAEGPQVMRFLLGQTTAVKYAGIGQLAVRTLTLGLSGRDGEVFAAGGLSAGGLSGDGALSCKGISSRDAGGAGGAAGATEGLSRDNGCDEDCDDGLSRLSRGNSLDDRPLSSLSHDNSLDKSPLSSLSHDDDFDGNSSVAPSSLLSNNNLDKSPSSRLSRANNRDTPSSSNPSRGNSLDERSLSSLSRNNSLDGRPPSNPSQEKNLIALHYQLLQADRLVAEYQLEITYEND